MEEPGLSLAGLALLLPPRPAQMLLCVFCQGLTIEKTERFLYWIRKKRLSVFVR